MKLTSSPSAACHRRSIQEIAAKDYPADLVQEWSAPYSEEVLEKFRTAIRTEAEWVWVAVVSGQIEGFASLVPAQEEVRAVYVTAVAAGQGVGQALLNTLEEKARELGLKRLQLHSSVTAKPFYLRNGYTGQGEELHQLIRKRDALPFDG